WRYAGSTCVGQARRRGADDPGPAVSSSGFEGAREEAQAWRRHIRELVDGESDDGGGAARVLKRPDPSEARERSPGRGRNVLAPCWPAPGTRARGAVFLGRSDVK